MPYETTSTFSQILSTVLIFHRDSALAKDTHEIQMAASITTIIYSKVPFLGSIFLPLAYTNILYKCINYTQIQAKIK